MKKKLAILFLGASIFGNSAIASIASATATDQQTEADNSTQFQKVVDEYKAYLADVNVKIRDEIVAYRKEIARLNRLKREEYQKLSQEGQAFLAKEQEFKKKLPFKQRKAINIINPGEQTLSNDKTE